MPGAMDEEFLRTAVTMNVSAIFEDGNIQVDVEIINDRTGHHVPTDSPLRHLILLVQARDADENPMVQTKGLTLPDWCGVGDQYDGYFSGLPGKAYAKILQELWTEVSPSATYWNRTRVVSDNRIPAYGIDKSTYTFEAPASGVVTVDVQLIFRRAFIIFREWKGWDVQDIIMDQRHLIIDI